MGRKEEGNKEEERSNVGVRGRWKRKEVEREGSYVSNEDDNEEGKK